MYLRYIPFNKGVLSTLLQWYAGSLSQSGIGCGTAFINGPIHGWRRQNSHKVASFSIHVPFTNSKNFVPLRQCSSRNVNLLFGREDVQLILNTNYGNKYILTLSCYSQLSGYYITSLVDQTHIRLHKQSQNSCSEIGAFSRIVGRHKVNGKYKDRQRVRKI